MSLCFIDPADAIRAIADSIGREARRQLLGEAVRAWVDEIPDDELEAHYAKAISELDEHDISMLAASAERHRPRTPTATTRAGFLAGIRSLTSSASQTSTGGAVVVAR